MVNHPDRNRSLAGHSPRSTPGLVRPVCGHARLRSCASVTRREHDGVTELYDAATGVAHRLSPAAADLWADLDGRPLAEVRPAEADDAEVELAVIELVRRLKALELVEDLP